MSVKAMLKCFGDGGADVGAGMGRGAATVHIPGGRSLERADAERSPRRAGGAGRRRARDREYDELLDDPDVAYDDFELLDLERPRRGTLAEAEARRGAGEGACVGPATSSFVMILFIIC